MGSRRGPGRAVWGLAATGCLAVAAVAACASAVPGASSIASPGATATVPGAPVAVASAVVAATKAAPNVPHTATPRASTSPVPSTSEGGAPLAAGNPDGHATVPAAGQAVATSDPGHVIGDGTPASCTSAAVVAAVAAGGVITFSCGPAPVTITMTATATVPTSSHLVVLDGGDLELSAAIAC